MVMRFFLIFGLILLGVTGYFTVIQQSPAYQAAPAVAAVSLLQSEGILPSGDLRENEALEHDVFDVPTMDEAMLEAALSSGGMAGMDMSGGAAMKMDGGNASMETADGATTMKMDGDGASMETTDGATTMKMDGDGASMETTDGATAMKMDGGNAEMAMPVAEGGLRITDTGAFDREIKLSMLEWGFSQMQLDVKQGEKIRFTVRNDGKILHEFMFMTMPAMAAVNYRAKRADWNLLEHEALFEKSLLLPGGEVSFVVQVQETGNWMFMCMLPYHMEMGMMGQMATEGRAMEM